MVARDVLSLMVCMVTAGHVSFLWAAAPVHNNAEQVFRANCSVCHGEKGDGRGRAANSFVRPPRDFTAPQAAGELTRDRLIRSIREGRPGTAMAAWKDRLTQTQIAALANYIRDRFMLPVAYDTSNEGRRVYAEYCSVCHGDKGNGKSMAARGMQPAPRDFTSDPAKRDLTRDRIIFAATYGVADTAMPGWGTQLGKEQIAAVADYIRRNFMELKSGIDSEGGKHPIAGGPRQGSDAGGHVHQHAPTDGDLAAYFAEPFPNKLLGNYGRGFILYGRNCVSCHGKNGDGRGPRAYFILPKPRNFFHPAARAELNRPHLFEVIAKGKSRTEMPAWETVLSPQQIADISEYVLKAFVRPSKIE